jgi:hypothetical protein
MNPDTGAIAYFETAEDAEQAGHTVPLPKKLAGRMLQLPRQERMPLILDLSPFHPLAQLAGMTEDDVRKLRNAAKRARRERR